MYTKISKSPRIEGMTLVETMVGATIGLALMALVAGFFGFSFQSVAGLSNYSILEYASRRALDELTYDIRQAHAVITNSPNCVELEMLHPDGTSGTIRFEYDGDSAALNMVDESGQMKRLLSDCESLTFSFFQRPAPGDDWNNLRDLGTNSPSLCKVVQVQWKCARSLIGSLQNTEIMQSTKVVLRSSNWKTDEYAD